jgi:serine/threonine protein kinase
MRYATYSLLPTPYCFYSMLQSLINQRVGRYIVKELLGRGGMAAVYRATDTALQRDIALKILYPQYSDEQSQVERFKREAITAAALEHPHIVPVYDVDEQNGMVYIAMKLLSGYSLQDMLQQRGTLSPTELLAVLEPVASALDYAHDRGVVHRDIKPGNILIEQDSSGRPRVMLADFGIAKVVDSPGLTTTGAMIGTPDYMPPEQIAGRRLDRRADVYALGMLAFRALTGRRAFEGSTQDVLLAHLHSSPPKPSARNPQLSPAFDPVILGAINADPDQRPASAGAFVRALREANDGATLSSIAPVTPVRTPVVQQAPPIHQQPTTVVQAPTQPKRTTTPALAQTQTTLRPPQPVPVAVAAEPRRSNWFPWLVVLILGLSVIGLAVFGIATLARNNQNSAIAGLPTSLVPPPDTATPTGTSEPPTSTQTAEPTSTAVEPSATIEQPGSTVEPSTAPTDAQPSARPATPVPPSRTPVPQPPPATNTIEPTATLTPSPTETPSPTLTPSPSPTPCPEEFLRGGFGRLFREDVGIRVRLGCPGAPEAPGIAAQQFFVNGTMFYWQANDTIYVFLGRDTGTYVIVPPTEAAALPTPEPQEDPNAPVRGFGRVYYGKPGIREVIGQWTTNEELLDGTGVFQRFERGLMIFTPSYLSGTRRAAIFVLFNDGTFLRVDDR